VNKCVLAVCKFCVSLEHEFKGLSWNTGGDNCSYKDISSECENSKPFDEEVKNNYSKCISESSDAEETVPLVNCKRQVGKWYGRIQEQVSSCLSSVS
jgi:hypothetical protein